MTATAAVLSASRWVTTLSGRIDTDRRAIALRLGLTALGLQLFGVHARKHLTGRDEITFVDHYLPDPPGYLGRDVDFDRFNAAVPAGDAIRKATKL